MKYKIISLFFMISVVQTKIHSQNLDLVKITNDNIIFQNQKKAFDSFDKNKNNIQNGIKLASYYGLQKSKKELLTQIRLFSDDQAEVEKFKKQFETDFSKQQNSKKILKPVEFKNPTFCNSKKFKFKKEFFPNNI